MRRTTTQVHRAKAAAALAMGATLRQAAKAAGVHATTVWKWRKDGELTEHIQQQKEALRPLLRRVATKAFTKVEEALDDGELRGLDAAKAGGIAATNLARLETAEAAQREATASEQGTIPKTREELVAMLREQVPAEVLREALGDG